MEAGLWYVLWAYYLLGTPYVSLYGCSPCSREFLAAAAVQGLRNNSTDDLLCIVMAVGNEQATYV